jgi:hypothetical protein
MNADISFWLYPPPLPCPPFLANSLPSSDKYPPCTCWMGLLIMVTYLSDRILCSLLPCLLSTSLIRNLKPGDIWQTETSDLQLRWSFVSFLVPLRLQQGLHSYLIIANKDTHIVSQWLLSSWYHWKHISRRTKENQQQRKWFLHTIGLTHTHAQTHARTHTLYQ